MAVAHPDEVRLTIELSSVQPRPDAALAQVSSQAELLANLLDELGVEREARSTVGVGLDEVLEWEDQRQVRRGHRATSRALVRLLDAELVGRLLTETSERIEARVAGPWWWIAPDNPARLNACERATVLAQEKAAASAAALGRQLGGLIRVRELGGDRFPPNGPGEPGAALVDPGRSLQLDVDPGQLEVWATVEVTFALQT